MEWFAPFQKFLHLVDLKASIKAALALECASVPLPPGLVPLLIF